MKINKCRGMDNIIGERRWATGERRWAAGDRQQATGDRRQAMGDVYDRRTARLHDSKTFSIPS